MANPRAALVEDTPAEFPVRARRTACGATVRVEATASAHPNNCKNMLLIVLDDRCLARASLTLGRLHGAPSVLCAELITNKEHKPCSYYS